VSIADVPIAQPAVSLKHSTSERRQWRSLVGPIQPRIGKTATCLVIGDDAAQRRHVGGLTLAEGESSNAVSGALFGVPENATLVPDCDATVSSG